MTDTLNYELIRDDDQLHTITITPLNQSIPGGDIYVTGVFRLTEGEVGMGDIEFDDQLQEWKYTGTGDLTLEEAAQVAEYIKDQSKRIM